MDLLRPLAPVRLAVPDSNVTMVSVKEEAELHNCGGDGRKEAGIVRDKDL